MKIAGLKNAGAWSRNNERIRKLRAFPDELANLVGSIGASTFIDPAFNAIKQMATEVGVTALELPANVNEWATAMGANGIPLQVWMGKLSWTTYAEPEENKYIPNAQSELGYFANDLRKIVSRFFLARRQLKDVFNIGTRASGNVGGMPNSDNNPD